MTTPPVLTTSLLHLAPPSLSALSPIEVKRLVLDYLSSCCYPDSAAAFAREAFEPNGRILKSHLNGNGTETHTNGGANGLNGKEKDGMKDGMEIELEVESSGAAILPPAIDSDGDDAMECDKTMDSQVTETNSIAGESKSKLEYGNETEEYSVLTKVELDQIRLRRDIRDHILAGRIQLAIDLIHRHFPSVLESPAGNPTLKRSYSPTHFFLPTSPIPPLASTSVPPYATPDAAGPSSLVLRPMIVSLYLNLQSWVEMVRTASIASEGIYTRPSTPISFASHLQSAIEEDEPSDLHDAALSGSTSSLASISSTRTSTANLVVAKAQQMYRKLRDMEHEFSSKAEKALYEKEVLDFTALLAYRDISNAPDNVKKYLDFERRTALSDLVGAAILVSINKTAMPVLSLAARQTTAIWSCLAEWKVSLPSASKANGSSKDKKEKELLPRFDLNAFISESNE